MDASSPRLLTPQEAALWLTLQIGRFFRMARQGRFLLVQLADEGMLFDPPDVVTWLAWGFRTGATTDSAGDRMLLYADEDFPLPTVEELRQLGHDVLTAQEDGRSSAPDPDVLARAHSLGRAVLTHNRRHYERLHRQGIDHSGILSATQDRDHAALAARIDAALANMSPGRWCLRVNRPP